ncbi:PIG-L family deacetylase [Nocardia sp. NBC_01730]|uniref:PIG-L deacetylase family protein n=1 Tax=Nocardia sp. NBC_01730 TaxID=2975998 RepID=UPI002E12653F|nr:PIG-L family deacetylase [Nocardia sp. NBC_01730]
MSSTCVFLHAHPDDESLLTAGTMARLAAEGHRVVLVVATDGEAGLTDSPAGTELGARRRRETMDSAAALGCARVEFLGYGDSGSDGAVPDSFSATPVEQAAERIAALLVEERAELVTSYDPAGGYGHPDHVHLHHVGSLAARIAGTPVLLEATVDRDMLLRAIRIAALFRLTPTGLTPDRLASSYSPGSAITHRVNVRCYAAGKRASMAAHASQAAGGDGVRTLAALLRLPQPVFRWVLGTEWFVRRDV